MWCFVVFPLDDIAGKPLRWHVVMIRHAAAQSGGTSVSGRSVRICRIFPLFSYIRVTVLHSFLCDYSQAGLDLQVGVCVHSGLSGTARGVV